MKGRIKINGIIITFAVLLISALPSFFLRSCPSNPMEEAIETFGIALMLMGQILRVSARGYKSEHSQDGSILIQSGPYAFVRNPMYLGILLIGIGIVLMVFKWWVALIFLAVFSIRYMILTFKEEKKLKAVFGRQYEDYCKLVPRILPSLGAIFNKDIREFLPLKISWLKKEICPILLVLFITLLIESWEDIKNEGFLIYLKESSGIFITIILFIGLVVYLSKRTNT